MNKDVLKKIVIEQSSFDDIFVRRDQMEVLKNNIKNPFVIILSGMRRCGKSVLLHQFRIQQPEKNYYLNFDDDRLQSFSIEDFETLYECFLELYGEEHTFYFDEIQNIHGWEKFVRRLHDAGKKIYITGSNANLLSRELGTHLTGRYIQIELFPFSFSEFLLSQNYEYTAKDFYVRKKYVQLQKLFHEYREKGGFPLFVETEDTNFFKFLYESIVYKDIIVRHKLRHEKNILDMLQFLFSNISSLFSFNALKNVSNISNASVVKEYVHFCEDSYLLFPLTKFDYSVKKQLMHQKKIYAIDTAFSSSVSFQFSENIGQKLENIVFLHLRRQGKKLFYHHEKYECDFVVEERGRVTDAYQVTQSLQNSETQKREIRGLLDALEAYEISVGYILTEDEYDDIEQDGKTIHIRPLWRWLLEK